MTHRDPEYEISTLQTTKILGRILANAPCSMLNSARVTSMFSSGGENSTHSASRSQCLMPCVFLVRPVNPSREQIRKRESSRYLTHSPADHHLRTAEREPRIG